MSHISICYEDDLSVYEIRPMDRQGYNLIVDCGGTHHIVFNSSLLTNIKFNDTIDTLILGKVRMGNGSSLPITIYRDM